MLGRLKAFGPVQAIRRARYRRFFASPLGFASNFGVFRTFAEAMAAAPSARGFDQPEMAKEYDDRFERVFAYDYPVLFWLDRALDATPRPRRLLDIGGHMGLHYQAYGRYLTFPEPFTWCVCEVDEVAKAGRARAERAGLRGLEFTTSFEDLDAAPPDIVLSSGALQYIERPLLWEVLERCSAKPAHVLLNKIPIHDGEDFVSLQNIGVGFAPHFVWNRRALVHRFERAGYRLEDEWSVPERRFLLFDDTARSFGAYGGLYLRRV